MFKTYFAIFCAAGLLTAAIDGCSSSDDATSGTNRDGGLDGSFGQSGDDDFDGGVCQPILGSTLKQCDCNPVGSINADDPVCGCPGITGQIGSGPTVGRAGGRYVSGTLDGAKTRLLMGVMSIQGGSIWTVDLKTGNRAILSGAVTDSATGNAQTTGTGDAMIQPTAIRLGTDGIYAFEGTTSTKQIQKIDVVSGARTTLLTADQMRATIEGGHPINCSGGPPFDTSSALPESGMGLGPSNEIYVAVGKSPSYVAVAKITTGGTPTCTIVSGDNYDSPASTPVGSGPNIEGINNVDFANGVIYALDSAAETLFTIDPATGARTALSAPVPIDSGVKVKDAGYDGGDASYDAGYDAAGGNGSGQVTPNFCFTDRTSGSNVFAFASGGAAAWSGTGVDSAHDLLTNINLSTGQRTCFTTTVPCHPDQTNGQAIDLSVGIFPSPTGNMILTAGPTTIWTVDTLNHVANVISE